MQAVERMLHVIKTDAMFTAYKTGLKEFSPQVMAAMAEVPRHAFVAADLEAEAYENHPLPIGHEQTISQPYIVALMTELLQPKPQHRILEVGCGSGYQAAILSQLVDKVISLEIIHPLAESARQRLTKLGYGNVEVIESDGHQGWPEQAPYDGIIVAAAPEQVPPALVDQLAQNAHLIIPVGDYYKGQILQDIYRDKGGQISEKEILAVSFVPLRGKR